MWAGEAEGSTVAGEEVTEGGSEKFAPVVALHALNGRVKLGADVRMKTIDGVGSVGFVAQRKGPGEMREIINYHEVVLKPGKATYRRCP